MGEWLFSRVELKNGKLVEVERHELDSRGNHHSYATNDEWRTHGHRVVGPDGKEYYCRDNVTDPERHPWKSRYNG